MFLITGKYLVCTSCTSPVTSVDLKHQSKNVKTKSKKRKSEKGNQKKRLIAKKCLQ